MPARWLYVRSTINLAGFPRGSEAWIDVNDPQFAPLLERRFLIAIDAPEGILPPDDAGQVVGAARRPIESEDELELPDEADEAPPAPPGEEPEGDDIDDAGELDEGDS